MEIGNYSAAQYQDAALGSITLENINNIVHELGELKKRWDNRLTFENLNIAKSYADGRLTLICYFSASKEFSWLRNLPIIHDDSVIGKPTIAITYSADTAQNQARNADKENTVLVDVVELTEKTVMFDSNIATIPSSVGFYCVQNRVEKLREGLTYFQIGKVTSDIVPFSVNRELSRIILQSKVICNNPDQMVERTSEIMDCITDNERNHGWQCLSFNMNDHMRLTPRIRLNGNSVEVRFIEGIQDGLQLLNVAIGPFDF